MDTNAKKHPTLQDVADALGMHKSTVSLALSGKGEIATATRERIAVAARELGYEPNPVAQRLARGGQQSDLVCAFTGLLDVGLGTQKILSIQQQLNARSLEVPIYTASHLPGEDGSLQVQQIRQLCRQRPRAFLCASQRIDDAVFAELADYQRRGGIVVSYDTPVPLACDQVLFDREENAYRATRYLLDRGHCRVGFAMSSVPGILLEGSCDPVSTRLRGFRRALRESGLEMRDDWFYRTANYECGGADLARQFLRTPDRPTALCIVNDYVALAFMVEVMRAGIRIPHDVSLVSHDNQPIAEYTPVPLTSMTHPADRISEAVVSLLMDRIEGHIPESDPPRTLTLQGELVERATVSAPSRA